MRTRNKIFSLMLLFMFVAAYFVSAQQHISRPHMAGMSSLATEAKAWVNLRTAATETAAAGYDWTSDNMVFYEMVGNSSINPTTITTYIDATNGIIDVWDELGWGTNAVKIAFYSASDGAANDEDDTFDFELYAFIAASNYGPAMPVYTTTGSACIVGTGVCAYQPIAGTAQTYGRWVDTISGSDLWPSGVTVNDSGNNRICTLTFDMQGSRFLLLRTFNSAGGASEAGSVGTIITAF